MSLSASPLNSLCRYLSCYLFNGLMIKKCLLKGSHTHTYTAQMSIVWGEEPNCMLNIKLRLN